MSGAGESAIERFLRMPIPYHPYAVWAKNGDAEAAAVLTEYEDAKRAALAEFTGNGAFG